MNPSRVTGRVPPPTRKLVIRKTTSQRDLRALSERVTLERVLGLSVPENSALACDPSVGLIAYPAGCVVVLFNARKNKQSFIVNNSKKTITCVAFSKDGKCLVTGESGHMPSVRVWDVEDPSHPQVSEMEKGHKFGVQCVSFSPNMKYVVSVGYHHDMLVNIWNWKTGSKLASNKVSSKVFSFSFSPCGSYFLTSGVRHVKFWYLDDESKKKAGKTTPLFGRSALLSDQRNNTFCGVACGMGENADTVYSVTKSGLLCAFDTKKRALEKYVQLRASKARCIAVSERYIFCGCTDGIIRVFDPSTLNFIATLPKPHSQGVNVADGLDPSHLLNKTENATHADTVAMALDDTNNRLTCVYSDRSLYVWDVTDIKKIGKTYSALYHRDCVWGVEVYPPVADSRQAALPSGSFLTCSSDDTVRVWNVHEGNEHYLPRNIYSKELMRILYTTSQDNPQDQDAPPAKNARDSDYKGGVRCIRISHDGQLLALGDRSGNVRIYDLLFFDELINIEAHESEVLCVEFSPPSSGHNFIATAGRDRLIHVFDIRDEYNLIQTVDDHSASITSVKFNVTENKEFQLLSCGADKSMIFRSAQKNPDFQFVRATNYVGKTTLYDMDIEQSNHKLAATAGQDRNVRVYDVVTGKQARCFKGSQGDDGTLIRISLDSSGLYAVTSCSDKSLSMYELDTGECVASMLGHSEIVTGLRFTADCKNVISVSGDGCIFIWKIPKLYSENMTDKLVQLGREPPKPPHLETPLRRDTFKVSSSAGEGHLNGLGSPADPSILNEISPPVLDYRFSVGQLPAWAKKQLIAKDVESKHLSPEQLSEPNQPEGRWAQRVNGDINGQGFSTPVRPLSQEEAESPYALTPISLEEQMAALRNSPLERRCSLTKGEDDDLFPERVRAQVEAPRPGDELRQGNSNMAVTASPDRVGRPARERGSSVISLETGEIKFEQAQEQTEDEVRESIIYLPTTQDDFDSQVASLPKVKSMARHFECLHEPHKHSPNDRFHSNLFHSNGCSDASCPRVSQSDSAGRNHDLDLKPSKLKTFIRSFRITSAHKPQRLSLNLEDIEGTETDLRESLANGAKKIGEGSSEEDDEALTPTEDAIKSVTDKLEGGRDSEGDGEDVCSRYFESLGSTATKEKPEEEAEEKLAPFDALQQLGHRLSISARFLSRSQTTSARGTNNQDSQEDSDKAKLELEKRREDMKRQVDESRKRLEQLGWKSARRSSASNAPAALATTATEASAGKASKLTVTVKTARPVASSPPAGMPPERDTAPASSPSPTAKPPMVASLSESRLLAPTDQKAANGKLVGDKDQSPHKRSASDLIAFFSHPKFSHLKPKNKEKDEKDKEKNDKEREKGEKGKEKKEEKERGRKEKEREKEEKEREKREKEEKKERERKEKEKGREEKDREKKERKDKEKRDTKVAGTADRDKHSSVSRIARRSSADELNLKPTTKSWKKSLGIGSTANPRQDKERKSSAPSSRLASNTASVLSRINEAKSERNVPLREKKGRVTAEERRAKARSLGDVGKELKPVEVAILDPPERTVSTMDLSNERSAEVNSALLEKMPTAGDETPTTGEHKPIHLTIKLSPKSETSPEKQPSAVAEPVNADENLPAPLETLTGDSPSAEQRSEASSGAPDSPVWVRRVPTDSTPPRSSPSAAKEEVGGRPAPVPSLRSPPAPLRWPLQAPAEQEGESSEGPPLSPDSMALQAQEAVQNLVRAFRSVTDLHEKALEQEPNEEQHQVLSMLSATFDAMGEECLQRKPSNTRPTSGLAARRFGSPFSFSTGNLDSMVAKPPGRRRVSESSACIPEAIQEDREVLSNHLEKYSDMLVEMVKAKLLK